jgi:hypothetical protein
VGRIRANAALFFCAFFALRVVLEQPLGNNSGANAERARRRQCAAACAGRLPLKCLDLGDKWMGIFNKYHSIIQAAASVSDKGIDASLYSVAETAYEYHVKHFGPPKDPTWKFEIVTAPYAGMARDPFRRMYILTVREYDARPEQRLASVVHEVYHRITSRRIGLHKYLWVDEMLAFLSVHHFLCEHGLQNYAEDYLKLCYVQPKRLDIDTIKNLRRRPSFLGLLRSQYPPHFTSSIAVLATTMETIVGWTNMCNLVHCRSWREWLAAIPEKRRESVREIVKE